jgi:hypothetical protein
MEKLIDQPKFQMNRGAILAQGCRWLARWLQPDETAEFSVHLLIKKCWQDLFRPGEDT